VLLPEAVAPTTATVRPGSTVNVTSSRTGWSASYPKPRWETSSRAACSPRASDAPPYLISPVSPSTARTRSKPTTLRGNSPSSQPIDRIGKATTMRR
jgi:hypothetical protein